MGSAEPSNGELPPDPDPDRALSADAYLSRLADVADTARGSGQAGDKAAALAAAQHIAAWGLREAVAAARESGVTWRALATLLGEPAASLHRKYVRGGGLYAGSAGSLSSTWLRPVAPERGKAVKTGTDASGKLRALPLNVFVGRERDLADLPVTLKRRRLVTVTGPAGVGKTRLALEVAHRLAGGFRGGVVWVPLAGLPIAASPACVIDAVHAVLQAASPNGVRPDLALTQAREAGAVLLIMDNCEHLTAGAAEAVQGLLAAHPALTILATSRETLDVAGEAQIRLAPLPAVVKDPGGTWRAGSAAVRLFTERACLVSHDLVLAGQEPLIAAICNTLDGLPLAIELAARLCAVLPLHEIKAELRHQLDLAAEGPGAVLGPHTGLRAAIAWSYQLLGPVEQTLFRRLTLLPDGADDLTATALSGDLGLSRAEVWAVLTSLAGKSMLTTSANAPRRFGMLAAIREYGREQLQEAGETADVEERLLTWLTARADELLDDLYMAVRIELRYWASAEGAALGYATEYARGAGDPRYARLAMATSDQLMRKGHMDDARAVLEPVLALAAPRSDDAARARILMAILCLLTGDHIAAVPYARRAQEIAAAGGSPAVKYQGAAAATAAHSANCGDPARAASLYRHQLDMARALGDARMLPVNLANYARALVASGQHAEAQAAVNELFDLGHRPLDVVELSTAGVVALIAGDIRQAAVHYAEGLHTYASAANGTYTEHALDIVEGLAIIATRDGQPEHAIRLFAAVGARRAQLGLTRDGWRDKDVQDAMATSLRRLTPGEATAAEAAGATLTLGQLTAEALQRERGDKSPETPLTGRESAIAQFVAHGYTTQQIAARLGLAASTVTFHLARARAKLGLGSRTELAAWAAIHLNARRVDDGLGQ